MRSLRPSPSTPLSTNVEVKHFTSIDSTNLEARRFIERGGQGPLWIVADEQTAGRGRLGRSWQSVPGNLYSTFVFRPACQPQAFPQLGFVTALAVAETIDALTSQQAVRLKWPNDCLFQGSKIAGILCEVLDHGNVAIGCGINVASAPSGLAYPAATLSDVLGKTIPVQEVFEAYAQSLRTHLSLWQNGENFLAIADLWRGRAIGIGEQVSVKQEAAEIVGNLLGIDDTGALLLAQSDGAKRRILAGDLHIPSLAAMRNQI
jgi:BirA family transcriptional regulator, biotin operon repressor / biotin---[acetyl-CoA-carboxylase] ligase